MYLEIKVTWGYTSNRKFMRVEQKAKAVAETIYPTGYYLIIPGVIY